MNTQLLTQENIERQITEMYDAVSNIDDHVERDAAYKQANETENALRERFERQQRLAQVANNAKNIFHVYHQGDRSVGIFPAHGTIIFDTNLVLGEEEVNLWKEFIGEFFEVASKYVLTDEEYQEEERLIREEERKLEF